MSFGARPRPTEMGWRPPTTFVDVLFLVLMFFLTIAAFRDKEWEMPVALPTVENQRSQPTQRTQIVITITRDGAIYIGDQSYTPQTLRTTLAELARQFPGESVIVRGDQGCELRHVVRVMDIALAVGLKRVSLGTVKTAGEL